MENMIFGVPSGISLYCQQCEQEVDTLVQNGKVIYPHRPDLANHVFLQCPYCHNYVGADKLRPNDTLGKWQKRHRNKTIPTPEFRRIRREIHGIIDSLWQENLISRKEIYKRLSKATGTNYHNGSLCDIEIARVAYKEARKIEQEVRMLARRKRLAGKNWHGGKTF